MKKYIIELSAEERHELQRLLRSGKTMARKATRARILLKADDGLSDEQIADLAKLLTERKITVELTPEARIWLANRGYDPAYGARPLKRVIQKELVDPIARKLLAGDLADGSVIQVGAGDDGLNIGKATTDINLTGAVTGNAGGGPTNVGTGTLNVSKSATPQFASARGFAGIQINLIPARSGSMLGFFIQGSATSLNGFAIQTGLRCAW